MIDIAGMAQDRVVRKKQRFTPENHLIMAGPRQNSKQRARRLEEWLSTFSEEQLADQCVRYWKSMEKFRPRSTYLVSAWSI